MPLPEEVTKFIGKTISSTTCEIEKGAIARFAEAVGDPNPLYWDEEYARKSRYGSIIAPPGFFGWPVKRSGELSANPIFQGPNLAKAGYSRILDGGIEWEFFKLTRAGDKLTVTIEIKNIMEREGRTGKMVFMAREITYTNQNGELVATARQTTIHPAG